MLTTTTKKEIKDIVKKHFSLEDDDFANPFEFDSSDDDDEYWDLPNDDAVPLLNVISFGWTEDGLLLLLLLLLFLLFFLFCYCC